MDVDHLWSFFKPWAYAAAAFGAIRMLYKYWIKPRFLRPVNSVIKSFNGKVVLITGASQGIGEALARSFHAAGAKLILTARSIDKLKVLCEELNESVGNDLQPADYRYLDVTEPNGMDELVSLSPNEKIDILVHNAGIATYAACNDASDSAVRKQMEVNFFAPVNLTRMMEPHLSRGAVIVVVNSLQGLFAIPFRSAYGASKHALKAYFDSYRAEHSEDRHVLCVCPGYVNTNLALNAIGGDGKVIGSASDAVLSRGISPSEVASATLSSLQRGDSELVLGPFHHRAAALLRVVASDAYFAVMARRARDKVGAVDAHKKDRAWDCPQCGKCGGVHVSATEQPSETGLDKYLKMEFVDSTGSAEPQKHKLSRGKSPVRVAAASTNNSAASLLAANSASRDRHAVSDSRFTPSTMSITSSSQCSSTVVYVKRTGRDELRRRAKLTGLPVRERVDGDGLPRIVVTDEAGVRPSAATTVSSGDAWAWPDPPAPAAEPRDAKTYDEDRDNSVDKDNVKRGIKVEESAPPAPPPPPPRRSLSAAAAARSSTGCVSKSEQNAVPSTSSGQSIGMHRRSPLQKLLAADYYAQLIASSANTTSSSAALVDLSDAGRRVETVHLPAPTRSRCASGDASSTTDKMSKGTDQEHIDSDLEDMSSEAQVTVLQRRTDAVPMPALGTGRVRALVAYFELEIARVNTFARRNKRRQLLDATLHHEVKLTGR